MSTGFKSSTTGNKNSLLPWVLLGIFVVIVLIIVGIVRLTSMLPSSPTGSPTPEGMDYTFTKPLPSKYSAPSFIFPDADKAGWVGQVNPTSEKAKYVGKTNQCSFEAIPMGLKPTELQSKTDDEANTYFLLANSLGLTADEVKAKAKDTSLNIETGGTVSFKSAGIKDGNQYRMLVTRVFSKQHQASFLYMECSNETEASKTWDELKTDLFLNF